ncbi:hypothetical protein [Jiella sp. M17.18]|uniref:hypothetical protein n=1 Tax=Jiella sp. M17.18 TaxID=3234247 RepID=UPI0034DE986E
MATGLDSFDAFSWASLLKGRDVLVCDSDRRRALSIADALEEAGARATVAPTTEAALDRLARRSFSLAVVTQTSEARLGTPLAAALEAAGTRLVLLADPAVQAEAARIHPSARVLGLGISPRQLVQSITGTQDD